MTTTTCSVCVGISSTAAETKDLAHQEVSVKTAALTEGGTFRFKLLAATVDKEIILGDTGDVQLIFVKTQPTDQNAVPAQVTVKENLDTNEARLIKCLGDKKVGMYLVTTTGVTKLFVSNLGTVDMDITIAFGGD